MIKVDVYRLMYRKRFGLFAELAFELLLRVALKPSPDMNDQEVDDGNL